MTSTSTTRTPSPRTATEPAVHDVPVVVPRQRTPGRAWSRRGSGALRPPPVRPELAARLSEARRCRPWAAEATHLAGARMG